VLLGHLGRGLSHVLLGDLDEGVGEQLQAVFGRVAEIVR
jgi:hypothetical protein